MRNILKISLALVLLTLGTTAFSQSIGIRGGLSLSNLFAENNSGTISDDFLHKVGYHGGIVLDFNITNTFSIESGLMIESKGFRTEGNFGGITSDYALNLTYLDIPLTLKASTDNKIVNFYGILGPYVGAGLFGNEKGETVVLGVKTEFNDPIQWGTTQDDEARRLDYGLMIGAGVELGSIQLGLSYAHGLANIAPVQSNGRRQQNRVFRLSAAFLFGE